METFRRIDSCRICGNAELEPIISLGNQYLTGVFPRTRNESLTCGPLSLVRCTTGRDETCGLVQLEHSYASSEMYGDRYGYRSSLNRSMVDHLRSKVEGLMRRVTLDDDDVVLDIGSNDGTTLSFYPDTVTRIGMDPTGSKFAAFYKPGIKLIADFFSADRFDSELGGAKPKIVTSIAMFYDLDDPLEFVRQIAHVLHEDGIWHFEQSYLPRMLETNGYDTICHEHVEYYSLAQIDWMLKRTGLRIVDIELNDVNGGSFAVTACKTDAPFADGSAIVQRVLATERGAGLNTIEPFRRFADRVRKHRVDLRELLASLRRDGRLILGYGASTKGNVMLQYCGITPSEIPYIAEVNEEKFGAFTPGSGIPIISEQEAHAMKPDYLLAMPWHFRKTLLSREERFLDGGGRMIFPLPQIDIVSRANF
jgi:hypothetical protein